MAIWDTAYHTSTESDNSQLRVKGKLKAGWDTTAYLFQRLEIFKPATPSAGEDMEPLEVWCIASWNECEMVQPLHKQLCSFSYI